MYGQSMTAQIKSDPPNQDRPPDRFSVVLSCQPWENEPTD